MAHARPSPSSRRRPVALVALVVGSVLATSLGAAFAVSVSMPHDPTRLVLARSAGLSAYVALVILVLGGLLLAHPWSARWRLPSASVRIRLHVSIALATLVLTAVHIVMWATYDRGGVGWWGSFVPWGSAYRPVHVSLGVLGLYAGLLTGAAAALAGRWRLGRVWWPVHKVAVAAFVLVWVHALGGNDADALRGVHVVTGLAVVVVGLSRYLAAAPRDHAERLGREPARDLVPASRTWVR